MLAWPSLAENILSSLASIVDMIMVSFLGAYAVAAVGLVLQPKFIMLSAFMAMSVGTTALVAQNKGARNPDGSNTALAQSLILTAALTALICTTLLILAEPLIRLIAGGEISEQIIKEAVIYYRIQIYGFPAVAFTFTINAALRGAGNTRATFYNNTVANLVNVVFNYCLIGGNFGFPRMEVAGASLATVIGQIVAFLMAFFVIANGKQYVRIVFRKLLRIDWPMMKRVLNIGIPSFIDQTIMRVGALWFTTIVTALGDIPYTAHMVAMNIQMLSFTTGMAFGTAATTLVGQSIGRKRIDLARVYVRMTQNIGLIVSLVIAFLFFFFGKFFTGMYSDDAVIIALSSDMLKIIAISNPVTNARQVFVNALRGAGDAKFVAVLTFISMLMVRPLAAQLFVNLLNMGLYGIWLALTSDFVASFFLVMFRFKRGKWSQIVI
jgi:putative MATE family efflux protein